MRAWTAVSLLWLGACADPRAPAHPPEPPTPAAPAITWAEIEPVLASHICMQTFEVEGHGKIEEPVFGLAASCDLPAPRTAIERAVERSWTDAAPVLGSMRHAWEHPVRAALEGTPAPTRLAAIRAAYLSGRFADVLARHLARALADEGLDCADCPAPAPVPMRTIPWSSFAPYLAAYAWPDPVETPRDADGNATGAPEYHMHVCVALNGLAELPVREPILVEAGFVSSLHNQTFLAQASAIFTAFTTAPELAGLDDDDARTAWLRARVGAAVAREPAVRRSVCETLAQHRDDLGLVIDECAMWQGS